MEHLGVFDAARITKIADEVQRITQVRHDYISPRSKLAIDVSDASPTKLALTVRNGQEHSFPIERRSLLQLAGTLDFPVKFLERLQERGHNDIVAANLTELLSREDKDTKGEPRKHLIRELDGSIDAVLSDSYRSIASADVLALALQEFERAGVSVWDLRHTPTEFRILAVAPHIAGKVTTDRNFSGVSRWEGAAGDVLNAAVSIGNSETGHGRFYGKVSILRRVCQNFCVWGDGVAQVHLGKKLEEGERVWTSEETRTLEDKALVSKLKDVIRTSFSAEAFRKTLDAINLTTTRTLGEASVTEVVDASIKVYGLPLERREAIIERLLKSGDKSQFGASNAISAEANPDNAKGLDDAARSTFEDAAGAVLKLNERAWKNFLRNAITPKDETIEAATQTVSRVR